MNIKINKGIIGELEKIVRDTSSKQRKDFSYQNRVFFVCTEDETMDPKYCAQKIGEIWKHNETGSSVIGIFKDMFLTPPEKRERIFKEARGLAFEIINILAKGSFLAHELDSIEKRLGSNRQTKRIVLNYLYRIIPDIKNGSSFNSMLKLNKDFAGECIDSLITYIKVEFSDIAGTEEYEKEIFRLEADLKRSSKLLLRLQDEFDELIEQNRKEEAEKVILLLNSQKYGHILDLLINLQAGIRKLRRAGKSVPLEINSMPSLVRQLLQFIEDCGITPIEEIGKEITVSAADTTRYQYQGTPFANSNELKKAIITSTGWEIKDKELIISLPIIQEKE